MDCPLTVTPREGGPGEEESEKTRGGRPTGETQTQRHPGRTQVQILQP